jgi:hypothetical protein
LVRAYIFHTCVASGSSLAICSGSHWLASVGDSTLERKSGEPEKTGEGKELVASVSCRDEKRLSERMSLYMEEASGRLLVPGDLGESLTLCRHDLLVSCKGDKPFPAIEESRDIVAAWNDAYGSMLGVDGDVEEGDIHSVGCKPAFDRPAVTSGLPETVVYEGGKYVEETADPGRLTVRGQE